MRRKWVKLKLSKERSRIGECRGSHRQRENSLPSVYECLAISEGFALAEEHFDAQIVIAAGIEERWATVIQNHHPTLHLKPDATAKDVLWELNVNGGRVN